MKNKKNRNENLDKNKHRVGSKSLAVRVHEGVRVFFNFIKLSILLVIPN